MAASITVKDLEVVFPPPTADDPPAVAVGGVSFDVEEGELVVLVGRSGCGKTSVLNVLAGLYRPTGGQASIMGKPPLEARDHIGYMFARDGLLPWRTARRNVEFALEIRFGRRMSRSDRRTRAVEYLEKVGVGHALNRYPWQLSNGMRQRVALARTWAIDPDVLFMDEPFAALDAQTRADVQGEFLRVWGRNQKTAVFVTHDLKEAVLLADRIIVMRDGRIVDEVTIQLARPRDENLIEEDPQYRKIHHRLIEGLQLDHRHAATEDRG